MSEIRHRIQQQNNVLSADYQPSANFYLSDQRLRHFLSKELTPEGRRFMENRLRRLGELAAGPLNDLAREADRYPPELVARNWLGEPLQEIRFHPAYEEMKSIAIDSGMFFVKWNPELRERFRPERHRLGFATGFLFAMSESGLYCPLCMTDGAARLLDLFADAADRDRLLPHIFTRNPAEFFTGAMFLTEKSGGSDVGANQVSATVHPDGFYRLNGEKWFCSNANAEIIFALARTDADIPGTPGLSLFLVEPRLPDQGRNPMAIVRLKDKLGVRSMASAEIIFTDTCARLVGAEGQGFRLMTEMINLSRLYNSVAATALSRRALIEAYQFLRSRSTFGACALDHALVRDKLQELAALQMADFYLSWRAISALDHADQGDERELQLLRLLTPMVKKATAENSVYIIRESMELMGGLGYIEDGIMPRLLRDALVLPIWEGAGNIMVLDMLRATLKSRGFQLLCEEIARLLSEGELPERDLLLYQLRDLTEVAGRMLRQEDRGVAESTAGRLFSRLTRLLQIALLHRHSDGESDTWIRPALSYLCDQLRPSKIDLKAPPSREVIEAMLAWEL